MAKAANIHSPIISVACPKDAWPTTSLWLYEGVYGTGKEVAWIALKMMLGRSWYLAGCAAIVITVLGIMSSLSLAFVAVLLMICLPPAFAVVDHLLIVYPMISDLHRTIRNRRTWDSSCCYWVAHCHCQECKGAVVAVIGAVQKHEHCLQLVRLVVSSQTRRCGLGLQLSKKVLEFAKEKGYWEVQLQSLTIFVAASKLYKKLGFQVFDHHSYGARLLPLPITVPQWKLDISAEK